MRNVYSGILQLGRFLQIMWILFRNGVAEVFDHMTANARYRRRRKDRPESKPQKKIYTTQERLRITIEDLGPTYIKFGQILADRPDIISERFRKELKKLQAAAKPFPDDQAIVLVEKELRARIDDVFESFDHKCFASASIGQVYTGRLRNGEEVIVKIQRPQITSKIKTDLYLMRYLAKKLAANYPDLAAINIVALIDEFGENMIRELDYLNEAANIKRFRHIFQGDDTVYIPKVYLNYSTSRLLVMERVRGITPDDPEALSAAGLSAQQIAVNGANALLKMILVEGFFHADPHPGNIFIKGNNVVTFIDFGMVGSLRPRDTNFLADFALGFVRKDSAEMAHALLTLCDVRFFEQLDQLEFEIDRIIKQNEDIPLSQVNFGGVFQSCIDIIVKYRIQIPSGIFMLVKALVTTQKVAEMLNPDISITELIIPYAKDLVKKKFSPRKLAGHIFETMSNYANLVRTLPNDVSEILYKLKEGKIKHEIIVSDKDMFVKTMRILTTRLAYVIVLIGLFVGASILIAFGRADSSYGQVALIVSSVLIGLLMLKWLFRKR